MPARATRPGTTTDGLQSEIDAEVVARATAPTPRCSAHINAEATARANGDASEATDRAKGDAALNAAKVNVAAMSWRGLLTLQQFGFQGVGRGTPTIVEAWAGNTAIKAL